MKQNVGAWSRVGRAVAGLGALTCSVEAPLPLGVRLAVFGSLGAYLLLSALTGRCLGARLLRKSGRPNESAT